MKQFNTLRAKKLCKTYSKKNVVNNVDITIDRGEVVGLLGPNGAGKTTTFYMITGMIMIMHTIFIYHRLGLPLNEHLEFWFICGEFSFIH